MAKKANAIEARNGEGETVSSYFKAIFKESPALLVTRSNDEILQRWLKDHPGVKDVPERIKGSLANIKSVLSKKKRKKPGRPKAQLTAAAAEPTAAGVVVQNAPKTSTKGFEQLEEQIDDCLTTARRLDRELLHGVISHLRKARNEVVWKLGQ
jgi:hypothetical protein